MNRSRPLATAAASMPSTAITTRTPRPVLSNRGSAEYSRIDRQCEKLTLVEEYLGEFSDVESLE